MSPGKIAKERLRSSPSFRDRRGRGRGRPASEFRERYATPRAAKEKASRAVGAPWSESR